MTERPKNYVHPQSGELFTPYTPEFVELLERMRAEHGTWRRVCWVTNTRMKVMRNLRSGQRKAISMSLVDRLVTTTGVGSLQEFTWFTPDDLIAMGIWEPVVSVEGNKRFQGDKVTIGTNKSARQKAAKARKQAKAEQRGGKKK